ncbi:AlbA family DNA-binding domain-containing protein [Porphyrobacter sp. LM 6]|uniref:AlbA family DNA-binding domain-containing protein n=1 Tax=Porphyrobacter sp. LM 6 TaxID=1896196 RepID=UPI0009F1F349|nr:ATP-binding protein [Porphyrobacter sp. LM 6]
MNYSDIVSAGLSGIHRLIENGTEESYQLDFKRKANPHSPILDKEDRQNLGAAASGFANAEGGILIFGVGTKNHGGIDRASEIFAIQQVEVAADHFRAYLLECVSPPIDDTEISALADIDGSGVIVIHIPKGKQRPHMSRATNHHRFYRRTADRFEAMERYEIEEMFRLISHPELDLVFEYEPSGSIGGNPHSKLFFGLENNSRTIAKFPYISIDGIYNGPNVSNFGLDGNGNTPWPRRPSRYPSEIVFSGGADAVIHPGQVIMISYFDYLHNHTERTHKWSAASLADHNNFSLLISFGCENFERQRREIVFSQDSLIYQQQPYIHVVM